MFVTLRRFITIHMYLLRWRLNLSLKIFQGSEVGTSYTVSLSVYSGTYLPICIEIGFLFDKHRAKEMMARFYWATM